MPEIRRCPHCRLELPHDAPDGVCPQCILRLGFAGQSAGLGGHPADLIAPGRVELTSGSQPPPPTPPFTARSRFIPPSPEQLAPHFPQLEILELLGQGGMGAVYKARQRRLDRLVALKILPPEVAAAPAFAERFTREARALARLSHPHIVAVYDFGQAGGLYYFLMEFVDGAEPAAVDRRASSRRARPWRSCRRSARPCNTPTTRASSTATSSPRTCCSTRRAG